MFFRQLADNLSTQKLTLHAKSHLEDLFFLRNRYLLKNFEITINLFKSANKVLLCDVFTRSQQIIRNYLEF